MNVNDLMIGDWVLVDDIHALGIGAMMPARVKQLYECGIIIDCGEGDEDCEIFKPVPLTHEILVKNGLKECFDGKIEYENFNEDKNFLLEITEEDGEVWWTINVAEYRIAKLEYVHQLQHAIRLLGIGKEIIL